MAILGVDIGGTRVKAGIVSEDGAILRAGSVETPADLTSFRDAVPSLVRELSAGDAITAVGAGCKGIINPASTVVEILPGTVHYLEGHSLADLLRPAIPSGAPVAADNDARVALAGELLWGAARGKHNVLMLTLGTGVGGGIVSGGQLVRGHRGVAGHLGHLTTDPRGPLCICGNRGCLETYFSARAIEAAARDLVYRGCACSLTDQFGSRPESLTCADVFAASRDGDPVAGLLIREAIERLGAALAGLLHLLDPELVIIGGQIAAAGSALFEPLAKEIGWRTHCLLRRTIPLVPAQVADQSGVLGAAALAVTSLR